MKIIAIVASIFLALITVLIYAEEQNANPATPEQAELQAPAKDATEAEILAYLIVINEGEVAAAQDAIQKNSDPRVVKFAEHMNKDHGRNLENTQKLANSMDVQPQETPSVVRLREKASGIRANLLQLEGGAFSNAYIDYMVRDHSRALDLIDEQFTKNVKSIQLQDHLKVTRSIISEHFAEAKDIQDDLK